MVYISKVYTRSGDAGETRLASGEVVGKDDLRIRAFGGIDELNAVIGWIRVEIGREAVNHGAEERLGFLRTLGDELGRIQQELFDLGAELATANAVDGGSRLQIEARHVERLERELDAWNDALEPLRSFVLPGGGPVGASCHLARTVCRRAERDLVALAREQGVRPEAIRYVNRLSDYLFVASRAAAQRLGVAEVLWQPAST